MGPNDAERSTVDFSPEWASLAEERWPGHQGMPWEQLPGETDKAYEAFLIYLHLEPMQRSVSNAFYVYKGLPPLYDPQHEKTDDYPDSAPGYFRGWSHDNAWFARRNAYIRHLESRRLLEQERKMREEVENFHTQIAQLNKVSLGAAVRTWGVVNHLLDEIQTRIKDGKHTGLGPKDVPSYIRAAVSASNQAVEALSESLGIRAVLEQLDKTAAEWEEQ